MIINGLFAILKEALEKSVHKLLKTLKRLTNARTLKAEFSVSEATNTRTKNLNLLFDTLKNYKTKLSN